MESAEFTPTPDKLITLRYADTGGKEGLQFTRLEVTIHDPHTPESTVVPVPTSATLETLIWNKEAAEKSPENEKDKSRKIQYVVMGGFAINAVEVHPIMAMLTNHADTIIGISHPEAPQSKLEPKDTPFNDERSFANSGYTVLRTVEHLIESGELDPGSPITFVGFSTGGAVGLEVLAQEIQESNGDKRPRFIQNAVFLSPGGMMEMGGWEGIKAATMKVSLPYWREFTDEMEKRIRNAFRTGQSSITSIDKSSNTQRVNTVFQSLKAATKESWERYFENKRAIEQWDLEDPAWRAIVLPHKIFSAIDSVLRLLPTDLAKEALAHFHRMWIVQPDWPLLTPETPAVKRSGENIGHDVTGAARAQLENTPTVLYFGEGDLSVSLDNFLTHKDKEELDRVSNPDERAEIREDRIIAWIKQRFPNNLANLHILISKGTRSHHLSARSNASMLENYILRHLYLEQILIEKHYTDKEILRLNRSILERRRSAIEKYFLDNPPEQEIKSLDERSQVRVLSSVFEMPAHLKRVSADDPLRITVYVPGLFECDKPNYGNHPLEAKLASALLMGDADAVFMLKSEGMNREAYTDDQGKGTIQEKVSKVSFGKLQDIVANLTQKEEYRGKPVEFRIVGYSEGATQAASLAARIHNSGSFLVGEFDSIGGAGLTGVTEQAEAKPLAILHENITTAGHAHPPYMDSDKPFVQEKEGVQDYFVDSKLIGDKKSGGFEASLGRAKTSLPADMRNIGKWALRRFVSMLGVADQVPWERVQAAVTHNPDYRILAEAGIPIRIFSGLYDEFFSHEDVKRSVAELRSDNPNADILLISSNVHHDYAHYNPSGVAYALELFSRKATGDISGSK